MKYLYFPKMAEANADGDTGGGSTDQNKNKDDQGGGTPNEADQLKADLAKERKEKADLAKKVTELGSSLEKLRVNTQKTQGEYKSLYEEAEKKIVLIEGERDKLKDSIFHTSRVSAVKDAAVKAGLRPAALSDIEAMDLDEIQGVLLLWAGTLSK